MAPCLVQDAQIPRLSLRHKKGVQRLCSFCLPPASQSSILLCICRNRVPGAAQSFTYQYLCETTTSHTLIRCTLESWNQSHTATISVKRTLEFSKRYVNNNPPMSLFRNTPFTGRTKRTRDNGSSPFTNTMCCRLGQFFRSTFIHL